MSIDANALRRIVGIVLTRFRSGLARSFFSEHRPAEPAIVAAAQAGYLSAQLMLGMALLRGNSVEQDNRAAYHWLRLAALNSARVLEEFRDAID